MLENKVFGCEQQRACFFACVFLNTFLLSPVVYPENYVRGEWKMGSEGRASNHAHSFLWSSMCHVRVCRLCLSHVVKRQAHAFKKYSFPQGFLYIRDRQRATPDLWGLVAIPPSGAVVFCIVFRCTPCWNILPPPIVNTPAVACTNHRDRFLLLPPHFSFSKRKKLFFRDLFSQAFKVTIGYGYTQANRRKCVKRPKQQCFSRWINFEKGMVIVTTTITLGRKMIWQKINNVVITFSAIF